MTGEVKSALPGSMVNDCVKNYEQKALKKLDTFFSIFANEN